MVACQLSEGELYWPFARLQGYFQRKGEIEHMKEFDCIGTEISKRWREGVVWSGSPFWQRIFKTSPCSSSIKSETELIYPRNSLRDILRFLFSVLSYLDILILLTPAQCFMKVSVFLLSDVIYQSLQIMAAFVG